LEYLQPNKSEALLDAAEELGKILNGLISAIKDRAA
jgi:hypothetical protein